MKRSPMPPRRTPLKASKPIRRTAHLRRVNPERVAKRLERDFGTEAFRAWLRGLGCSVPSCGSSDIEIAHARSRGSGGDWTMVIPLCNGHHRLAHTIGQRTFERRFGFEMLDVAAAVHLRWLAWAGRES
jgi:hypothetical protein